MIAQITERRTEIERLCREYRVRRLAVFGSALRDDFDAERSDIDFLVEFQPLELGENFETYFGLREGLMHLFSRKVDLVMRTAIRNPYFRREVERTHEVLYAV